MAEAAFCERFIMELMRNQGHYSPYVKPARGSLNVTLAASSGIVEKKLCFHEFGLKQSAKIGKMFYLGKW